MILPARLLHTSSWVLSFPKKIVRHVTSILMHTLIKFGIKNDCFIHRNNDDIAARLLYGGIYTRENLENKAILCVLVYTVF